MFCARFAWKVSIRKGAATESDKAAMFVPKCFQALLQARGHPCSHKTHPHSVHDTCNVVHILALHDRGVALERSSADRVRRQECWEESQTLMSKSMWIDAVFCEGSEGGTTKATTMQFSPNVFRGCQRSQKGDATWRLTIAPTRCVTIRINQPRRGQGSAFARSCLALHVMNT